MPDLFGAPLGILASDENIRQNALAGLSAQKLFGEIAQQPAESALKTAHARLFTAEAATKEEQLKALQDANALVGRYQAQKAESAARQTLVDRSQQAGITATVNDLPKSGMLSTASPLDDLRGLIDFAQKNNASPLIVEPWVDKYLAGSQKLAMAKQEEATAAERTSIAAKNQAGRIGGIASAAAASPENYRAIMMSPERALLPPQLTGNYATDAPVLSVIGRAAIESDKQVDNAREAKLAESKLATDKATRAKDMAYVTKVGKQAKLIDLNIQDVAKHGGKYSPEAEALNDQKAASKREQEIAARLKGASGWAPLDPVKLAENFSKYPDRTYVLKDTSVAKLTKNAAGQLGWSILLDPVPNYLEIRKKTREKQQADREKALERANRSLTATQGE